MALSIASDASSFSRSSGWPALSANMAKKKSAWVRPLPSQRVNHVQLGQEMRRPEFEIVSLKVLKKAVGLQFGEQLRSLDLDMLGKAERIPLLRYTHRAGLARPVVETS